jgi:S1-C subfamily serine protease
MRHKILSSIGVILLLSLIFHTDSTTPAPIISPTTQTVVEKVQATNTITQKIISNNLSGIVAQWNPYVVFIKCKFDNGIETIMQNGSGVLDTSNLLIFTNKHVITSVTAFVPGSCNIELPGNGEVFSANTDDFTISSTKDLAYIQIKSDDYIKTLTLQNFNCKDSGSLGDDIIILGYPVIGSTSGITVTQGIISGTEGNYFITDAKIDAGNSGGAAILVKNNCLLGLPTYSIEGKMESLGRILDSNTFIK